MEFYFLHKGLAGDQKSNNINIEELAENQKSNNVNIEGYVGKQAP